MVAQKRYAERLTPYYGPAKVNKMVPSKALDSDTQRTLPLAYKPYGDFGVVDDE